LGEFFPFGWFLWFWWRLYELFKKGRTDDENIYKILFDQETMK